MLWINIFRNDKLSFLNELYRWIDRWNSCIIALFVVFGIFLHCGYWIKSENTQQEKARNGNVFKERKKERVKPLGQRWKQDSISFCGLCGQSESWTGLLWSSRESSPNQTSAAHFLRQTTLSWRASRCVQTHGKTSGATLTFTWWSETLKSTCTVSRIQKQIHTVKS